MVKKVWFCLIAGMFSALSQTACADDIDIYKFSSHRPQVMVIIDNSGSMNASATTCQATDPNCSSSGGPMTWDACRSILANRQGVCFVGCKQTCKSQYPNDLQAAGRCNVKCEQSGGVCEKTFRDIVEINMYILARNSPAAAKVVQKLCSGDSAASGVEDPNAKILVARRVVKSIISENTDIDFGIMRFWKNNSSLKSDGGSTELVRKIVLGKTESQRTNQRENQLLPLVTEKQSWDLRIKAKNGTPLCKTYRIAKNYFEGRSAPERDLRCEYANIVYLTDGEPSGDSSSSNCLADAKDLYFTPTSKVRTYTIGFDLNKPDAIKLLTEMADKEHGNGAYYEAKDEAELAEKFGEAMDLIKQNPASITPPSGAVNAGNRSANLDFAYLSGFGASYKPRWSGNVKKYKFDDDGNLINLDGSPAYENGKLKEEITKGGFGQALVDFISTNNGEGYKQRKLLINNDTGTDFVKFSDNPDSFKKFQSELGLDDKEAAWAAGKGRSWVMGDILHAKPRVINYGCAHSSRQADGSCPVGSRDLRILFGTNAGFMHMFKDDETDTDGMVGMTENWAFYPRELTKSLIQELKANKEDSSLSIPKHPFGVDGKITLYMKDGSDPGTSGHGSYKDSEDRVYAFFGLRRGGSHYYAINLSDPDNPKLMWSKKFDEGQSWSRPTITYVYNSAGKKTLAMIVGGGYDTNKDNSGVGTKDTKGTSVSVVSAETGDLLWQVTKPVGETFNDGIVASITAMDTNGDDVTDRLYYGDTGGNVWRTDIVPKTDSLAVDGGPQTVSTFLVASIGRDDDGRDRRIIDRMNVVRTFFFRKKVDVLLFGTGDQAHPKDQTSDNRFYMIMDPAVNTQLFDTQKITSFGYNKLALANVTSQQSKDETIKAIKTAGWGWYISLDRTGEKSWNPPVTLLNTTFFTTYTPPPSNVISSVCDKSIEYGDSYMYAVDLLTGQATSVLGGARSVKTFSEIGGLPPEIKIQFGKGKSGKGKATLMPGYDLEFIKKAAEYPDEISNTEEESD